MGGKGSGRPRGSYKRLHQYLADLQEDVEELEDDNKQAKEQVELTEFKLRILKGKIDSLRRKAKLEEYRRKIKKAGK